MAGEGEQPADGTEHPAARLSAGSANAEGRGAVSLVSSELPRERERVRLAGASASAKDRSEQVLPLSSPRWEMTVEPVFSRLRKPLRDA